jgi:uncharacterized protein with ParB-like and HNH nuclease domain
MQASETKFQPIIEGTKQYVVPLFQRAYSWDKKEWEILWDDLLELCDNAEPKFHFIGSIVTMPTTSVPEGVTKYLLVDGQQRLTTIFVILTLLRNTAKAQGEDDLFDEINQTMLVNKFKKDLDYYKLLPTQADRDSFKCLIDERQCDNKSQLAKCYNYYESKLRQGKTNIQSLNRVITTRLSVVSIVLDPYDNPHLVFESLNAKGRPLTQSDLIRNYFFMRIHVDDQEKIYNKYWEPMQTNLGDQLTECIRHYQMREGMVVRQNDVYFTLKDRIPNEKAHEALKEISIFANYYDKLLRPEKEADSQLQEALLTLNRLEVTTCYPFLLNCYHAYSNGSITATQYLEILKIIENYIIRRWVCNIPRSELNKLFPYLYSQALKENPTDLVAGVRQILQGRSYPKDNEFRKMLIDNKLYGAGERGVKTKLLLEKIERSFQHKEQIQFEQLSIEHIMPQNLTQWWQDHLGEDFEADHDILLHTIGNLTLTSYNPELSNCPFQKKKEILSKSHLELNSYFAQIDSWDKNSIEKRAKILADTALMIWPYFGDSKGPEIINDDATGTRPQKVIILGQEIVVDSWRDVLEQTLNTIAELEPDKFVSLAASYPRYISNDDKKYRSARKLINGYFIEVNLTANQIHKFCVQMISSIDLSEGDWKVIA